jgi:hypothetical protein
MDNSVPTAWWKMMLCGTTLAFFNVFAYWAMDSKSPLWAPVKAIYSTFGPGRVMAVITGLSVLFLLAALVEKVREREDEWEDSQRPQEPKRSADTGKYRWVDVD